VAIYIEIRIILTLNLLNTKPFPKPKNLYLN